MYTQFMAMSYDFIGNTMETKTPEQRLPIGPLFFPKMFWYQIWFIFINIAYIFAITQMFMYVYIYIYYKHIWANNNISLT